MERSCIEEGGGWKKVRRKQKLGEGQDQNGVCGRGCIATEWK